MTSLEGWLGRTAANYTVHKRQVTGGMWSVANTHERQRPRDNRGMRSLRRCVCIGVVSVSVGLESCLSAELLFGWRPKPRRRALLDRQPQSCRVRSLTYQRCGSGLGHLNQPVRSSGGTHATPHAPIVLSDETASPPRNGPASEALTTTRRRKRQPCRGSFDRHHPRPPRCPQRRLPE